MSFRNGNLYIFENNNEIIGACSVEADSVFKNQKLVEKGFNSVHLFVAKSNIPALKTYKSLKFDFSGECSMFGHEYFAMEYIADRKEG